MTPFEKDVVEYSKKVDKFTSSTMAIDMGYDTNVPYIHLMKMWRKGLIAKVMDNANWVYTSMPDVLRCPQCGNWPRVTMGGDIAVAVCQDHFEVHSDKKSLANDWNNKVIDWQIKYNEKVKQ